jgi:hypothetical protein
MAWAPIQLTKHTRAAAGHGWPASNLPNAPCLFAFYRIIPSHEIQQAMSNYSIMIQRNSIKTKQQFSKSASSHSVPDIMLALVWEPERLKLATLGD